MAVVHIGIGSNMGDRHAHCARAVEELRQKGLAIRKVSSMYETEPWGMTDQPKFVNMAVEANTELSPEELLKTLKEIEVAMGRKAGVQWGPRIIDLDILFYDDRVIAAEHLRIPHPLLHQREFVLLPLSEIAPDKVHPVFKKTVRRLSEEFDGRNN